MTDLSSALDVGGTFVGRIGAIQALGDWFVSDEKLFVVRGAPGAGKTALAQELLRLSERPDSDGDSERLSNFLQWAHFCRFDDAGNSINPYVWVQQLSTRLCALNKGFKDALIDIAGDGRVQISGANTVTGNDNVVIGVQVTVVAGAMPVEEALRKAVTAPLARARETGFVDDVVILVDALDEALRHSGDITIVDLVKRLLRESLGVRAVLTTRSDNDVLKHFDKDVPSYDLAVDDPAEALADVEAFVRLTLAQLPQLSFSDGMSMETVVTSVATASAGNFLYARQVLTSLASTRIVTRASLTELPQGLDELYLVFLERLIPDRYQWRAVAPVAAALAVARAPLTNSQLSRFGKCDPDLVQQIATGDLRQFVEFDGMRPADQRVYSVYHRSFADFLLDQNKAGHYWCDPQAAETRVVDAYLGGGIPDWRVADDYGLLHLPEHASAITGRDVLRILTGEFLAVKADRFSYGLALEDLQTAGRVAALRGDALSVLRLMGTLHGVRATLADLSLTTTQGLLQTYALAGRVDLALDLVSLLNEPIDRVTSLREIIRALAVQDRPRARQLALSVKYVVDRAEALEAVTAAAAVDGQPDEAARLISELADLLDSWNPATDQEALFRSARLQEAARLAALTGSPLTDGLVGQARAATHLIAMASQRWNQLHSLAGIVAKTSVAKATEIHLESLDAPEVMFAEMANPDTAAEWTALTIRDLFAIAPEAAIEATRRITSPLASPLAIAEVARDRARVDPVQASRIIEEAIRDSWQIRRIPKAEAESWADDVLARLAAVVHTWDAERAAGLIEQLVSVHGRDTAHELIATDPEVGLVTALTHARLLEDDYKRDRALDYVARRAALTDADTAWTISSKISGWQQRCNTLAGLGRHLLRQQDARGAGFLDEMAELLRGLGDDRSTNRARLADFLEDVDPGRAADLRRQALDPELASDTADLSTAHAVVARSRLRDGQLSEALSLARKAASLLLIRGEQAWVTKARVRLIGAVAASDWQAAQRLLDTVPEASRPDAETEVLRCLADVNPEQAITLLPDTPGEQEARQDLERQARAVLSAALISTARRTGNNALAICEEMWRRGKYGPDEKSTATAAAARLLADSDPELAEALLSVTLRSEFGYTGDWRELGKALAAIAKQDAERSVRLARAAAGRNDEEFLQSCVELASELPEEALKLCSLVDADASDSYGSLRATRAQVGARAASRYAPINRGLAEQLLAEAEQAASAATFSEDRAQTLLECAAARFPWDLDGLHRLLDEVLQLCTATDASPSDAVTIPARIAGVLRRARAFEEADAQMRSALLGLSSDDIRVPDYAYSLDVIRDVLSEWPEPKARPHLLSLLNATLLDGRLLIAKPAVVMQLLLDCGVDTPLSLLAAMDDAQAIARQMFVG